MPGFGISRLNAGATLSEQDGVGGSAHAKRSRHHDVIVADNDSIIRGILRSVLEAEGFTVLFAVNGIEAIDLAMRTRARLIILDYKMPRLDGVTSCAEIRALDGYADVPILILTAFDDAAIRQKAERAGATAFLAKPFTPVDLLRTIARLVGPSPRKGHTPAGLAEPTAVIWNRRREPAPLFGEPVRRSARIGHLPRLPRFRTS